MVDSATSQPRVLLVEDEAEVARAIALIVRGYRYDDDDDDDDVVVVVVVVVVVAGCCAELPEEQSAIRRWGF